MSVPSHETLMLPLLQIAGDGEVHTFDDACARLALRYQPMAQEISEPTKAQYQLFRCRFGQANAYLVRAALLQVPDKRTFQITARGKQVLAQNFAGLTDAFLMQFPEFAASTKPSKVAEASPVIKKAVPTPAPKISPAINPLPRPPQAAQTLKPAHKEASNTTQKPPVSSPKIGAPTPDEQIQSAYHEYRQALAEELRQRLEAVAPSKFEQIVVSLLIAMGYGGGVRDQGKVIGGNNDGGIDGIIKQDVLGLDCIYVQAKRWARNKPVGEKDIREFAGVLESKRASKGVYLTTSSFTKEACEFADSLKATLVLLDGAAIADYMITFGIGVTERWVYRVKRIDAGYFTEPE